MTSARHIGLDSPLAPLMRPVALALLLLAAPTALASPQQARVQKEEGDRLRKAGDVEGAVRAYQAALALDGASAAAHEALGEVQYASRQTDQAIESFGHAVEIDPTYALAWYNLAFAARKSGDQARARSAYEQYVTLRPTDPDGHHGLAETQRALGNRAEAIAQYQLFIDLAGTSGAQAARVEEARAALAELRAAAPATPAAGSPVEALAAPVVAVIATVAAPANTTASPAVPAAPPAVPQAAPQAVPQAVPQAASPPASAPAPAMPAAPTRAFIEKMGGGDRSFLAGDYRAALFAYQDTVYLDPTSAVARIRLARAYSALGRKELAAQQLKQALELDPGNVEARRLSGSLADPSSVPPPPVVSVTAPPSQATPPSQKVYRLTDEAGGPPPPSPAAATVATTAADHQAAARHYRKAVAMIADRDFKGAIVELDQAILSDPQLGVAFVARASAFHGMGQFQEAVRDYQSALRLAPELAAPLYGLAEAYRQLRDPRAGEYFARYAESEASDVRPDLRRTARERAIQLGSR